MFKDLIILAYTQIVIWVTIEVTVVVSKCTAVFISVWDLISGGFKGSGALLIASNDAAEAWQLGFQDSAAPGFTGLVTLHNTIGFYIAVISFGVFWFLFSIVYYYRSNKNPIAHKYLTHGTVLELIWTISPALLLIAIAFPSFRLLYLMDCPTFNFYFLNSTFLVVPATKAISIKDIYSKRTDLVPYGNIGSTTLMRLNK